MKQLVREHFEVLPYKEDGGRRPRTPEPRFRAHLRRHTVESQTKGN